MPAKETEAPDANLSVNDIFARFFKSLGYGVTYEGLRETGERWHEVYDSEGIICQVEFETPLAEFLADLPYWGACRDDEKLRRLLERVRSAAAVESKGD